MSRDPRYDILFEPVQIGPVTAKNRFYQVPHCSGMGYALPETWAAMRGMKAAGGWGVVCTEYCSMHPTSDDVPYPYASLWDEGDVKAMSLMTEAVHAHGALAGVELWHGGSYVSNLLSREAPLGVVSLPSRSDPVQSRPMDREDIQDLLNWQAAAAKRARTAGFDIVYVYATHGYLLSEFLSAETNDRSDEYGGSLENRLRIVRELIEVTREAVAGQAAVAVRFSVAAKPSPDSATREDLEALEMLGPLADLWDIVVDDYAVEMGSSRFVKEAALEPLVARVRGITGKPVVSVGRFTSPDTMVRQVKKGVLDFIGAARPSIADPFLPTKIAEGRLDDIRECIGCNICYAGNSRGNPIRCTQNPTMGEEWRRGWHPEVIPPKDSDDQVLVVGSGPAGLEAARALGQRGYQVVLAEAGRELGGRVTRESRLPGLSEWARVRDHRVQQITKMANVSVYLESELSADQVREFGFPRVLLATGANWRRDGRGRYSAAPLPGFAHPGVLTPDDVMAGRLPQGKVVVFDDDWYYMAAVVAEALQQAGAQVTLVSTAGVVGQWSFFTDEQWQTQRRLMELGVEVLVSTAALSFDGQRVELECVFTGRVVRHGRSAGALDASALVSVTSRQPDDGLYRALTGEAGLLRDSGIRQVTAIGDCRAPALIAQAVYAGHRAAREMDGKQDSLVPRRERAHAAQVRR